MHGKRRQGCPFPNSDYATFPFLLSPLLLFSPPLPSPFTGSSGMILGKFLDIKMLVGEFQSILDIKINTFMSQVLL